MGPASNKCSSQAKKKRIYTSWSSGLRKCKEREELTNLKIRNGEKEEHGHSQQFKLNNFNVSFWDIERRFLI